MRLLLIATLLLTLLFAVCITLIRAQPYDDSDLRAFLTPPDGCPMPCFMGIRPGVTTREEVLSILEAHTWIGEISFPRPDSITWEWNGLQPQALNPNPGEWGGDFAGYIRFNSDNTVFGITVLTRIHFGDVFILLDKPRLFDHRTIRLEGVDYTRSPYCTGRPPFYWHTAIMVSSWDYPQYSGMGLGSGPACIDD